MLYVEDIFAVEGYFVWSLWEWACCRCVNLWRILWNREGAAVKQSGTCSGMLPRVQKPVSGCFPGKLMACPLKTPLTPRTSEQFIQKSHSTQLIINFIYSSPKFVVYLIYQYISPRWVEAYSMQRTNMRSKRQNKLLKIQIKAGYIKI